MMTKPKIQGWAFRWLAATGICAMAATALAAAPVTFVFTSDVHYGINRGNFRGSANVESRVVDAALVEKIDRLPAAVLPSDNG
jgi:hypothetical protein